MQWIEERSLSARQSTIAERDEEKMVDAKDTPASHMPTSILQRYRP